MRKALFLDRDGVINYEKNYLFKINDFEFIEGVFETCKYFQGLGYLLIIVTNQAGIARGYYSEANYQELTDWMLFKFREEGVNIDSVYHCPHHPDYGEACECRKPMPGMLLQAAYDHDINLEKSIMVGDKISDIQAAKVAKITDRVLVKSGHLINNTTTEQATLVIDSIKALPFVLNLERANE